MALLLPPLAGRQRRARAARPRARARARRGAPRRRSSAARCARRRGCRASRTSSASRPGRGRRAWRAPPRDLADLRPLDARHRIEIDAQLVGMIEIVGAHRMRVQLEAGEVGHPDAARRRRAARLLPRCGPTESCSATTSIQSAAATPARASDRRTRRRCRSDSGRARWAVRRRRAARRRRPRGSSARIESSVSGLRKQDLAGFEIATSRPATCNRIPVPSTKAPLDYSNEWIILFLWLERRHSVDGGGSESTSVFAFQDSLGARDRHWSLAAGINTCSRYILGVTRRSVEELSRFAVHVARVLAEFHLRRAAAHRLSHQGADQSGLLRASSR